MNIADITRTAEPALTSVDCSVFTGSPGASTVGRWHVNPSLIPSIIGNGGEGAFHAPRTNKDSGMGAGLKQNLGVIRCGSAKIAGWSQYFTAPNPSFKSDVAATIFLVHVSPLQRQRRLTRVVRPHLQIVQDAPRTSRAGVRGLTRS